MAQRKISKWAEIKADYLRYLCLDEISRKHNVSINTLKSRIRSGKWKQERNLMDKVVISRSLESSVEEEKNLYLKIQKEWYDASVKMYQELIAKVKDCNDVNKLHQILTQFMTFCEMNGLVLNPEHPDHSKIFINDYDLRE